MIVKIKVTIHVKCLVLPIFLQHPLLPCTVYGLFIGVVTRQ